MKILITGASGFIGSYMVERALAEGMETFAGVRATSSRRYLQDERISFVNLDLENEEHLSATLREHALQHGAWDAVIHCAGATKVRQPSDFYRINTEGTRHLATALVRTGALREGGRLVFISSLSVLGALHEKDGAPFRSADEPCPNTAYGASKLQAEAALREVEGLNYVVLRPTGVYGPRESDYYLMFKSVSRHIDLSIGKEVQHLSFIYVSDLVDAAFSALERGGVGESYILSEPRSYTSEEFCAILQEVLGVKRMVRVRVPRRVVGVLCRWGERWGRWRGKMLALNADKYHILTQRNWACNVSHARLGLNFEARVDLREGCRRAARWYKEKGWL